MSSEKELKGLYPFLYGKPQDPASLDAALLHSVEEKARESRETNMQFFHNQAPILVAAAKALAGVYRRGGRMFSMETAVQAAMHRTSRLNSCIPSLPAARRSPLSISSRILR